MISLEHRILGALLLGSSTISELALLLSSPRHMIEHRVYDLMRHMAIVPKGRGEKPKRGKTPYKVDLTESGRAWAREIMGYKTVQLIDRIGKKLSEQPLTLEDLMSLLNKGSVVFTRGEVRVELTHLLASQMITAKVAHGHDLYSLTKLGRKWMAGATEDAA